MNYKYANNEHTAVNNLDTGESFISPGIWQWREYQTWVASGGITEPFDSRTQDEIAAEAKSAAEEAIRGEAAAKLLLLSSPYQKEERETWITQEAEARAWTVDNSVPCPMITAMAATRGISLALMAQKIIENADLFKVESGKILGEQQKALDELN